MTTKKEEERPIKSHSGCIPSYLLLPIIRINEFEKDMHYPMQSKRCVILFRLVLLVRIYKSGGESYTARLFIFIVQIKCGAFNEFCCILFMTFLFSHSFSLCLFLLDLSSTHIGDLVFFSQISKWMCNLAIWTVYICAWWIDTFLDFSHTMVTQFVSKIIVFFYLYIVCTYI